MKAVDVTSEISITTLLSNFISEYTLCTEYYFSIPDYVHQSAKWYFSAKSLKHVSAAACQHTHPESYVIKQTKSRQYSQHHLCLHFIPNSASFTDDEWQ